MYNKTSRQKTTIKCNNSYKGERIEEKIHRIMINKEPIKDGAPIIYTERKDGVQPAYDIRTDRFEVAVDAMDKVASAKIAKRDAKVIPMKDDKTEPKIDDKNPGTGANTSE